MTTAKKKAPAKKKASAKKTPAKKPPVKTEEKAPETATTFKEVRGWADCKGKVIQIWHPALGVGPENGYHKAKVLHANVAEGTVLVQLATKEMKGRYLLPLDSTAAKVK